MLGTSFSPWPSFTQEEADAVSQVLLSNRVNYWTGKQCRDFEREFAQWCKVERAIAVANGTLALDLALAGLGIGAHYGGSSGDEVIVPARTFLASATTVANAGATVKFADVDRASGNISAETIAPLIGPSTKAVIVVHLAGWPCDMDPIMELARAHNLLIIEDCAQAHGALYKGRPVGSIGDVSAWSFCQDKIMTTGGEGGMVTTNDHALADRMWSYKDHGKSWEAVYEREHPPGFRWLHESFGTNWRLTEMQAAIGRIQLKRMERWSQARRDNASALLQALAPFAGKNGCIRVPVPDEPASGAPSEPTRHAFYKFHGYLKPENLAAGWDRDRVIAEISNLGVPCFHGSSAEIYLERAFDGTGWRPEQRLPNARILGDTSVMFLVHPTLTEAEMEQTSKAIDTVLSKAQLARD